MKGVIQGLSVDWNETGDFIYSIKSGNEYFQYRLIKSDIEDGNKQPVIDLARATGVLKTDDARDFVGKDVEFEIEDGKVKLKWRVENEV